MVDVARIQTSTRLITSFQADAFSSSIDNDGNGRGGDTGIANQANKSKPQPAVATKQDTAKQPVQTAASQVTDMRKFFAPQQRLLSQADYFAINREMSLFESLKNKAVSSSSWKQALSY